MKKLSDWHFLTKILLSLVIGVFTTGSLSSQIPMVTSFTPTSGPVGSSVTIAGTNFSTTASNNIVWFGAVKANVTAATPTSLSVTVPTGTNYQPVSVTVNGLTGYSKTPFNVTFPSSTVIDANTIALKVDFSTGTLPYFTAISDIDTDGKPDLVVANYTSGTISIYKNTSISGSISSGSFASKVDFATGTNPYCIAIGDIDGDGMPDIAVTNYTSNTVSVLKNSGISGSISLSSFSAKVDFSTGSNPCGIIVVDIDGDGKMDLAIANNASSTMSILKNKSTTGYITTGSFASKIDFTTGSQPRYLTYSDIDGDGKPDLAVTNQNGSSISVFRNTSVSGSITTGSLSAKVDFTGGSSPTGIASGDLDGDGKPDLAVANAGSNSVSIFRNTSTSGSITTGSFASKVDFTSGVSPYILAIGDLDGDGKQDLSVTNYTSNTFSVFKNNSTSGSITSGSFAAKVDYSTGTNPYGLAMGDVDLDGKPDIAVTNSSSNSVSVLRNTISGPPIISSFTPALGPIGTTVTISGNNFNSIIANNIVWFGAVRATVTAATSTSLSVTVPTCANYQPIIVTNVASGLTDYSNVPFIVTFPSSQIIDATSFASKVDFTSGSTPYYNAISDIDGDGKPDLVVINYSGNSISVYRNTSTLGSISSGSFAAKVDFTTGTGPYGIAIGDVDGDGKPDIAVTNYSSSTVSVFRNTSTSGSITSGSFNTKVDFTTGTSPNCVAIGDLDGDGKPELVVTNNSSYTVSVFRNTSASGSITTGSFTAKVDFTTGSMPVGVCIGDIDGDFKPDLAIANSGANTVSLLRNTSIVGAISSGSFAAKVDFLTGGSPRMPVMGDIDRDGKPDLLVANNGSNTFSIFRNTGTPGSINTGSLAAKVDFSTGSSPMFVSLGDMDGDGKTDIAVANNISATVSVFRNTSISGSINSGSFTTKVDFATGSAPIGINICDLDGDGKPDFSVTNTSSNTVSVIRNSIAGPTYISSFTPTSGPVGSSVTITGNNFNSTAANNIVWFGAVRATVTGATSTSLSVNVPTGATFQPINVTNVTTGLSDNSSAPFIVTFPSSQVIDVTSFASKVDFTTGTTPYFTAISDIDGDGKPDLVVTNSVSNTISVYRNTSTSGSISSGSFAAKVDFVTGTSPYGIVIGDIDGDGKPDVATANNGSNTVSVFRNTSTSGSITSGSFATKVDFAAGINPNGIALGDIDGDGKPELVFTNYSGNTISVLRNTASSGSITTGSFATRVDFTTGIAPYGVIIADIDGDLKPDITVTNSGSNTVSIFRNTSSYGLITSGSLAAGIDFPTGTQPFNLVNGDIDGDGKQDLLIINNGGVSVSVFRNTSTSGSVNIGSLATKVDFTTGPGPNSISLGDIDGDGKPDMAITNNTGNTVSVFRNISTSGSIGSGSFTSKVDFATGSIPVGIAIADIDGDGKPDLSVVNYGPSTVSILRNTVALPLYPNAPVANSASNILQTGFTANWNSSATATGYRLDVSTNSSFTTLVTGYNNKDIGNVLSSNVTGLTAKTTYYYRVRAYNGGGTSPNSGTISVVTLSNPPAAPTGLSAASCSNKITLKWRKNSDPYFARYRIYAGLTTNPTTKVDSTTLGINDTTKVLSGLTKGQTYYFRVTAINTDGPESSYSTQVSAKVISGVVPKIKSKWGNLLICFNVGDSIQTFQWYKAGASISNATSQYYLTNKSVGYYKVETTDKNGCKNISDSIRISGTKSLIAYPNPASLSFSLKFNDESDSRAEVSIINSSGIEVMNYQVENFNNETLREIPVKQLKEGIYSIRVVLDQEELYYTKIMVIK
jgi:hypothetical protein